MSYQYENLEWDTQFFKKPIGSIVAGDSTSTKDFDRAINTAKAQGRSCVYIEIPPERPDLSAHCSLKHDGLFVDLKVCLLLKLKSNPFLNDLSLSHINELEHSQDLTSLASIALELSRVSRFARDPMFGPHESYRLYLEWIQKSAIDPTFAEKFWTSQNSDLKICGLLTLRRKNKTPFIDLLGILPTHQGQGLGKKLIQKSIAHCISVGDETLFVTTQAHNLRAVNSYGKQGFSMSKVSLIYHKWFS